MNRTRPARHRAPQPRRGLPAAAAAATAVVALLLALTPSTGTQAQWYSEVQVATPGATTDSLSLTMTPASATVASVTNGSAEQTAAWAPRTLSVTPAAGSGTTSADVATFLRGARVGYTAGTSCAAPAATWTAAPVTSGTAAAVTPVTGSAARATLVAGGSHVLCLDVRPALTGSALSAALAGRTMTLTTTADSRSVGPATWTSPVATWATTYRVDLPRPDALSCSEGAFVPTTLSWRWAGTTAGSTPAIDRWEIWRVSGGRATSLMATVGGAERGLRVTNGDLGVSLWQQQDLMVRAYPFAGSSAYYAESTQVVTLQRNMLSNPGCAGTKTNTSTNPVVLP
ncbi:hypothetical protein [Georgenia wangjunii]|uniref:hypothetical protein n=1 Tax=Georgenia wangjunii TaxID=3117730 RepID=UPI002F25F6A2